MAKSKKQKVEEVSRKEINGNIYIFYSDGSVEIVPAPFKLTADEVKELFGEEETEEAEEDEEEESDDSEDDEDDDSEEEEEAEDSEEEEEEEEEELTPEQLMSMDFEELENLCDENDLETDPDDYDEDDIESFRKALAKELGITLPKPAKKEKPAKKSRK